MSPVDRKKEKKEAAAREEKRKAIAERKKEKEEARRDAMAKKKKKEEPDLARKRTILRGGGPCCRRSIHRVQLPAFIRPAHAAVLTQAGYGLTLNLILAVVPSAEDLLLILRMNNIPNQQQTSGKKK
jgi:hypothetical protein